MYILNTGFNIFKKDYFTKYINGKIIFYNKNSNNKVYNVNNHYEIKPTLAIYENSSDKKLYVDKSLEFLTAAYIPINTTWPKPSIYRVEFVLYNYNGDRINTKSYFGVV